MNINVACHALEVAETGDIEAAEKILVEYYSAETVGWLLGRMRAVRAFQPRMRLASLALADYTSGRYHASVPVGLALIDGLVNELHARNRGFSAEDVDLKAWDSIASHETGLTALAHIFQKGRRKTNVERLTVPYRHGIMHGMDLGYDNRLVAAKVWAALFAVRDWATRIEQGRTLPEPEEPEPTWREVIGRLSEVERQKALLAAWKPRSVTVGLNVPSQGGTEDYESGTPERALVTFLDLWNHRNYGGMATLAGFPNVAQPKPGDVRVLFDDRHLQRFELLSIKDTAPAMSEIKFKAILSREDGEHSVTILYRLASTDSEGRPAIWNLEGTTWSIVNWRDVQVEAP